LRGRAGVRGDQNAANRFSVSPHPYLLPEGEGKALASCLAAYVKEAPIVTSFTFPDLALEPWKDTRDTLHAYAQVLGAIRKALTPRQKHWWHTPLSVSAAGLTTTPIPAGERVIELTLSPTDHRLCVISNGG